MLGGILILDLIFAQRVEMIEQVGDEAQRLAPRTSCAEHGVEGRDDHAGFSPLGAKKAMPMRHFGVQCASRIVITQLSLEGPPHHREARAVISHQSVRTIMRRVPLHPQARKAAANTGIQAAAAQALHRRCQGTGDQA